MKRYFNLLQTYNTRYKSLKQKPFFLNFLENFLHSLFTPLFSRTQMCTSPSPILSYAYFGAQRRQFCLWNQESWVLESGIQHKKSGISLMIGIQNPSSTGKYWTPAPGIRNLQHGIQNPRLSWIPLKKGRNDSSYIVCFSYWLTKSVVRRILLT